MADDDHAEEWSSFRKELLSEIEKVCKPIDDLDRKIIIARGRSTACRVCSIAHGETA